MVLGAPKEHNAHQEDPEFQNITQDIALNAMRIKRNIVSFEHAVREKAIASGV